MNMMEMAAMEEVTRESWEELLAGGPRSAKHERIPYQLFQVGFVAGVAWARRQAETQPSSRAVGTISQCLAAVEEPEGEA